MHCTCLGPAALNNSPAIADLHVILVSDSLELMLPGLQLKIGQLDADRGPQCGAKVGGARGDIAKMVVV